MVRRCQRNEIEKDEKRIDRDRRFIVNFGEAAFDVYTLDSPLLLRQW
jgi:hypothetical protein